MNRVAVVGAGIAGLAAANALERARREGAQVDYVLLGDDGRAGGILDGVRSGGYVVDAGPDGFVASKPSAAALCREVGLGGELVETLAANRRTYVVHQGRLRRLPQGLFLVAPTKLGPIARTKLVSDAGKARIFEDLAIAPRPEREGDESIAAFVERRFGAEWSRLMAGSLLAGIYAGDPASLSVRATFPQLVAMEREHGSLIRGALAARRRAPKRPAGSPPPSAFLSLRGGMVTLVDALVASLPAERVRLGAGVRSIERTARGFRLTTRDGAEPVDADAVVLAVPAWVAGPLLEPLEPRASALLGSIGYASSATVYLGYARSQVRHRLDASGLLAPRSSGLRMTASTWLSSKWPGRAPEGRVLLRVFFGGTHDPSAHRADDATLLGWARGELGALIGLEGEPELALVKRHVRASPQPTVGHLERMSELDALLARVGELAVAGGGYHGVGIPDSITQGQSVARRLAGTTAATQTPARA